MAQQTSVDFLWRWWMDNPFASYEEGVEAYRKAKEIHHQEIINANWESCEDSDRAEQYYNKTFKNRVIKMFKMNYNTVTSFVNFYNNTDRKSVV